MERPNIPQPTLITKKEWVELEPYSQGYAWRSQQHKKESELRELGNPYKEGTQQYEDFRRGVIQAWIDIIAGDQP